MKQKIWVLCLAVLLSGCAGENRELKTMMEFRQELLAAESCSFNAEVTADYGDALHEFSMECEGDSTGMLIFEIAAPDSIAGIRGTVREDGGNLLFDEEALYFPLLTEEQLTPASAPWILLKSLRSGCITAVCREDDLIRMTVDDRFEEGALTLDVWMKEEKGPVRADILYSGRRILTIDVESFALS